MAPRKKIAPPADLAELDKVVTAQEEGRLIPIFNYDGISPLGFSIRVAGPDSKRADDARAAMQNDLKDRESLEPLTREERLEQGMKYIARITMGFEPKAVLDGRPLQATEEDAMKLFRRFRWIYKQVDDVAARREDFLFDVDSPSPSASGDESQVGE